MLLLQRYTVYILLIFVDLSVKALFKRQNLNNFNLTLFVQNKKVHLLEVSVPFFISDSEIIKTRNVVNDPYFQSNV